jgi:cell division protein ZapE
MLNSPITLSPSVRYQNLIAQHSLNFDSAQTQALTAFDELHKVLSNPVTNEKVAGKGVYLWGGVGRGKTFLMDILVASLPKPLCLRQHFHHFMRDVHGELSRLAGTQDPLKVIAFNLKAQYHVLCFDEFFVNDIGDAMLLGRLMMYLFDEKMIVVTTSNCEPTELYKDGLQRDNFIPAIQAIYSHMQVLQLAGLTDHRLRGATYSNSTKNNDTLKNYNVQLNTKNSDAIISGWYEKLNLIINPGKIDILGRAIQYQGLFKKHIVFDFNDLCLGPRSHFDYIEIAKQFSVIVLLNVPELGGAVGEHIKARGTEDGSVGSGSTGERQVMLAPMDDGARRFIALIDELYDQKIKLYLTCYVPLNRLYTQGSLDFQFERARSRLIEMGSEEYLSYEFVE